MESISNPLEKDEKIKQNLNELISYGGEIKRQNILDAEEISFNNNVSLNHSYDQYGFISNIKGKSLNK